MPTHPARLRQPTDPVARGLADRIVTTSPDVTV
jgi:hypothetical protein